MQSPRPVQLQLAPAPAGPPACSPVPARLADAPDRVIWRRKRKAEFDEVQLGSSKCSRVTLASTGHAEMSSLESIEFINSSCRPVRMLWINYDGHEVPYTVLQPGESKLYRTFAQHAWLARCLESARRMCINGAQATVAAAGADQARAVITDPPLLRWHESTHAAFPRPFRQQAAEMLLCWQRLANRAPGCSICTAAPSGTGVSSSRLAAPSSSCPPRFSDGGSGHEAPCDLGCLPFELVRHIIAQLAPADTWQEGRSAAHPDICPVQLHSRSSFSQLVSGTHKPAGQALPPRSRLSVEEVTPRQAQPPQGVVQWPRSPLAALNRMMNGLFGCAQ